MIGISQIKQNTDYPRQDLLLKITKKLKGAEIKDFTLVRRSLDARDKNNIIYSVTADVEVKNEAAVLNRFSKDKNIEKAPDEKYRLPRQGKELLSERPVVVGAGPSGLFCAYMLALYGYRPVLIERGKDADSRKRDVDKFHKTGVLDSSSNVQFGEGGAGTFSDGKLNCSVKDKYGRNNLVLKIFHEHGAKEEILYTAKPHLGTDCLICIVKSMRRAIIENGGEVCFETRLSGINIESGSLTGILAEDKSGVREIKTEVLVLATGHSARDTFKMLHESGLNMAPKAFAVGVRAEHLQEDINRAQYGENYKKLYKNLPAADYKLTAHTQSGRNVFSFCMCPGGYVINSSSERGRLCINGMSYSGRNGENANSAIIVNVNPEDTGADADIFAGVRFQEELERKAFEAAGGKIPSQRLGDFMENRVSEGFGRILPRHRGKTGFADLNHILPDFICESIKEVFPEFGRKIAGFDDKDVILSAVESRTSSPIRVTRDNESHESNIAGIYPCGEGAGYAGGITSAAMDGIKIFEAIYSKYRVENER